MSGPAIYPGAIQMIPDPPQDGGAYIGGPPRAIWHETITPPAWFYTGKIYYHLQFRQWPLTAKPEVGQFIPLNRASRALRNLDSEQRVDAGLSAEDVQTNRMGSTNLNVALVGYQVGRDNGYPSLYPLTDAMVNTIGEFVDFAYEEFGIPKDFSALLDEPGLAEAGYLSKYRFDNDQWGGFTGHGSHDLVVENTHHDTYWLFAHQMKPLYPGGLMTQDVGSKQGVDDIFATAWQEMLDEGIFSAFTDPDATDRNEQLAAFFSRMIHKVILPAVEAVIVDKAAGKAADIITRSELVAALQDLPIGDGMIDTIARSQIKGLREGLHQVTAP